MARARTIKPGFFQNEQLGELSAIDRLAFIGMWTIADYKGCIEFRPKRLKIQLMPYDNCDFEEIAINLDKSGLIRMYSVHGVRYIKIVNFVKHQNPHKNEREAGSDIPDFDENAKEIKDLENIQINPEQNGTDPAYYLLPITSSLLPITREDQSEKTENNASKLAISVGSEKAKMITLQTFLNQCEERQERPLRNYQPLWDYAAKVKLEQDLIGLAWEVFKGKFIGAEVKQKKYTNWRLTFLNYLKGNYLKLWYVDENGSYQLTQAGKQAQMEHGQ